MINPFQITNFNRTDAELEEFILFAVCVAGKTAVVQAKALEKFLTGRDSYSPFEFIVQMGGGSLAKRIKSSSLGQHNKIYRAFRDLAFDYKGKLRTCSASELEKVFGIGPKTSRFFLLHTRKGSEQIVFDTHLSKWFKERGIVPFTGTPSEKQYAKYEPICIEYLKEVESVTDFAAFDLEKWTLGTRTKPTIEKLDEQFVPIIEQMKEEGLTITTISDEIVKGNPIWHQKNPGYYDRKKAMSATFGLIYRTQETAKEFADKRRMEIE